MYRIVESHRKSRDSNERSTARSADSLTAPSPFAATKLVLQKIISMHRYSILVTPLQSAMTNAYATHCLAFSKILAHGPRPSQVLLSSLGIQLLLRASVTRSGWGMSASTRPPKAATPVTPSGEPLGL